MDKIVAAFPYQDFIVILTERGKVIRMGYDRQTMDFKFERMFAEVPLKD